MHPFDYNDWSLYTGPSNLQNTINDDQCPFVTGNWDGLNKDTSAVEIKKDIDARIEILVDAFKIALGHFKTHNRTFVVPEFFFRCKQGPYPHLVLDGLNTPFDYIVSRLNIELTALIPNDDNDYCVVIGTVLTSNIEDYKTFLASDLVSQRLQQLNDLFDSFKESPKKTDKNLWFRKIKVHHKTLSKELSLLKNKMLIYRADPLCTVRNRGIYFHLNKKLMKEADIFIYEKQYESSVDLTMGIFDEQGKLTHGGMITEWMANYPSYNIIEGDKQVSKPATNARFNHSHIKDFDIGVEICLDHMLQRLRRTVGMTIKNGAVADNYPIFKQIIPSGGMQILDYGVAADSNCVIFNADGCMPVYNTPDNSVVAILNGKAGIQTGITCGVYAISVQSRFTGRDGKNYNSHSQLAFTTDKSSISGFNNALGLDNIKAITYEGTEAAPSNHLTDSYKPMVIPFEKNALLFAAGTGEIHYYEPHED